MLKKTFFAVTIISTMVNPIYVHSHIYGDVLTPSYGVGNTLVVENKQPENPYTDAWRSSFLADLAHILASIPDPNSISEAAIREGLIRKSLPLVDPNKTYFNTFRGEASNSSSYNGWEHPRSLLTSSVTMTQAALLNTFSQWWDALPGELDADTGLYTQGIEAEKYDEYNDVNILSSDFSDIVWHSNIQRDYDNALDSFWEQNSSRYTQIIKDAYSYSAFDMHNKGQLTDTQFKLAMNVVKDNKQTHVYWLDIYGYYSNDVLVIKSSREDGDVLLYIPGSKDPFKAFYNIDELRGYISNLISENTERSNLARHFKLYDRQDGNTYSGVESALKGIGDKSWSDSYIMYKDKRVYGDVFESVVSATKARLSSDGEMKIHSNSEAQKDYALKVLNELMKLMPLLDLIAPEVSLPVGIVIATSSMGISVDKSINGDSTEERYDGLIGASVGGAFLAATTLIPLGISYASTLRNAAAEIHPTGYIPTDLDKARLPNEFEHIQHGDTKVTYHPVTGDEVSIVRLTDEDRVVAVKGTTGSKYKEIEWDTGREISNKNIVKTVNPENDEVQWLGSGGLYGGAPTTSSEIRTASYTLDSRKITLTSNGSEYFWGGNSASLQAFSQAVRQEHDGLIPLSDYSDGLPNYSASTLPPRNNLVVDRLENSGAQYDAAVNMYTVKRLELTHSKNEIVQAERILRSNGVSEQDINGLKIGLSKEELGLETTPTLDRTIQKMVTNHAIINRWEHLFSEEISKDFPVMYGLFINDTKGIQQLSYDVVTEQSTLTGPLNEDWMQVIYTNQENKQFVSEYLRERGVYNIPVRSFDDIYLTEVNYQKIRSMQSKIGRMKESCIRCALRTAQYLSTKDERFLEFSVPSRFKIFYDNLKKIPRGLSMQEYEIKLRELIGTQFVKSPYQIEQSLLPNSIDRGTWNLTRDEIDQVLLNLGEDSYALLAGELEFQQQSSGHVFIAYNDRGTITYLDSTNPAWFDSGRENPDVYFNHVIKKGNLWAWKSDKFTAFFVSKSFSN